MISFVIALIKIVFILGFLVFIHEGGHFLVAKLCKIRVNEFAIGFGPTIWKNQGKETKYALRLIPLGGFVDMLGEEERSEEEGSLSKASIPERIAVVAAGGLVNIIFALIVYFVLISCTGNNPSNIVDSVINDSGAAVSGIQSGDKIVKINGKNIYYKTNLDNALEKCDGSELEVVVERNGEKITYKVNPLEEKYNYTGIAISGNSENTTEIAAIYPKSPASMQGLEVNDIITHINGTEVTNEPQKLVEEINKNIGEKIIFTVKSLFKISRKYLLQ